MNPLTNMRRVVHRTVAAARSCYNSQAPNTDRTEKSLNQVTLLGRVGSDPQMRGSDERPVTIFTLATNSVFKDMSGHNQQKTEWHRVSVFKPFLRDTAYNYVKKGQRCLVQGRLAYGQITDPNGNQHTTATIVAEEIVFFSKGPAEEESISSHITKHG